MTHRLSADATGITARGLRVRQLDANEVQRVHLFVDANGDTGVVVRRNLWRFVHVPTTALRDPALLDGLRALVAAVHGTAEIDPEVDEVLAAQGTVAESVLDAAA